MGEFKTSNKVYIGISLDGFIAKPDGDIAFLDTFPFPENDDMGFSSFMSGVDAILMGRKTFEKVLSFGIEWPYIKPVFVWSTTLEYLPAELNGNAYLINGSINEIVKQIHHLGFHQLYIDGGKTIQSFLMEDAIDELIITTVPVLIGDGISLFGSVAKQLNFQCVESKVFSNGLCKSTFIRCGH